MAALEKNPQELAKASRLAHVPSGEEYEKMVSGMLYVPGFHFHETFGTCIFPNPLRRSDSYDSMDPALHKARLRARAWAHKYNNYFPVDVESKPGADENTHVAMLREILGRVEGNQSFIEPPFRIDYGCNISLGDRFYANFNLTVLDCGIVTIGDRVMCGPNVSIYAATHEVEVQSRRDNIEYALPVTIGDDCWIGGNVIILPGVTIGEGCTIAAGSIVTKDIPAWSVAKGSPAKVFKQVTPVGKP
jgi:acetyltransferase-like isoleucine patch superfamily enzyme